MQELYKTAQSKLLFYDRFLDDKFNEYIRNIPVVMKTGTTDTIEYKGATPNSKLLPILKKNLWLNEAQRASLLHHPLVKIFGKVMEQKRSVGFFFRCIKWL